MDAMRKKLRVSLVAVCLLVLLAGLVLAEIYRQAAFFRARKGCERNLVELGKAMVRFSMDCSESFPSYFQWLVPGYISNSCVFVCPASGHNVGSISNVNEWTDYVYVPGLKAYTPLSTVHAFCLPEYHDGKGAHVLRLDCSVRWYDAESFSRLTNTLSEDFGQNDPAQFRKIHAMVSSVRRAHRPIPPCREQWKRLPGPVANALVGLEAPIVFAGSMGWYRGTDFPAFGYYATCLEPIDLLVATEYPVDTELIRLAGTHPYFSVRYRAAYVLVRRGNAESRPVLESLCESACYPDERFLAWVAYYRAVESGIVDPKGDFSRVCSLFAEEPDATTRDRMADVLGKTKSDQCVHALISDLKANKGSPYDGTVRALGTLRCGAAVPFIIERITKNNEDECMSALGKIGTPEAIDYLVRRLDSQDLRSQYQAVEGLSLSTNRDVLPYLRKHAGFYDTARIGVARLEQEDPRLALLKIAMEENEKLWVRREVLWQLKDYDLAGLEGTVIGFFLKTNVPEVRCQCIDLLSRSNSDAATKAMVRHVFQKQAIELKGTVTHICDVVSHLNARFHVGLLNEEEMCRYLLSRHKALVEDALREAGDSGRTANPGRP